MKVYDQCIFPTITYGAETWNLTKRLSLELRPMHRAHERIILNLTWKDGKTAKWIRQNKVKDIHETISKLKWNWAGHIARMTDTRWTSRPTFWTHQGYTSNRGEKNNNNAGETTYSRGELANHPDKNHIKLKIGTEVGDSVRIDRKKSPIDWGLGTSFFRGEVRCKKVFSNISLETHFREEVVDTKNNLHKILCKSSFIHVFHTLHRFGARAVEIFTYSILQTRLSVGPSPSFDILTLDIGKRTHFKTFFTNTIFLANTSFLKYNAV